MAKKAPATSTAPRKRATSKKKPNGEAVEIESGGITLTIAPPMLTDDDIRVRAYHRYLERGAGDGGDFDDWVEAEKDLKSSRS
jgi:hypothetical protein